MASIAEELKIVPVLRYQDLNSAATMPADSINMKNYHAATFLVQFHALGGAATYVKVYSGATDAATTSALTFRYAFGSAAQGSASCDVYGAWATSANLSVAHATYDNYLLLIEVDAAAMDLANNEEWLTLQFEDTDTGATGNVTVIAALKPRYNSGVTSATALA